MSQLPDPGPGNRDVLTAGSALLIKVMRDDEAIRFLCDEKSERLNRMKLKGASLGEILPSIDTHCVLPDYEYRRKPHTTPSFLALERESLIP
jgi:hypothetical protein